MSPGSVRLLPVGLLLVALMVCGCVHPALIPNASVFMIRPEFEPIRTSRNKRYLEQLMVQLIQTGNEQELSFVAQMLVDPEFLGRLDSPYEPNFKMRQVRFERVLDAFLLRKDPYVDQLLSWMISASTFWGTNDGRAEYVYDALLKLIAKLVPLSPARIKLLVALRTWLDRPYAEAYLLSDGSPEAFSAVLEMLPTVPLDKIDSVGGDLRFKAITDWRSQSFINFSRVAVSTSAIRPILRLAILQGFFGYGDGWYVLPDGNPFAPTYYFQPYTAGSNEALLGLLDLAKRGHELTLSPQFRDTLVAAERKIRGILEERGVRW